MSVHSFSNSLYNEHLFLAIHSADEHFQMPLLTQYFTLSFLLVGYLFLFSDNTMAVVANKRQATALFLSTTVIRTRRHTELTKN